MTSNTSTIWILAQRLSDKQNIFLIVFFQFEKFQIFDQHVSMCDTTLKSLLILRQWYCYDIVYIIHYVSMEKTPFVSKNLSKIIYF